MTKRSQATTEVAIKNAKPEDKPYKMTAGQGMYLLVNPSGSKLWRLKYRIGGKEKTLSFGAYPQVTLAQARLKREQARQLLTDGLDPNAVLKQQRQQASIETLTLRHVAERWYKGKVTLAKKPWAASTAEKVRLYLEKDIYPALGDKSIASITRLELIELNEEIEKRGAFDIAKKTRQWLSAIFDDAFDRGEITNNLAKDLKPGYRAEGVERKHHPFVNFNELPELLRKVEATGSHKLIKLAVSLLMYTAVRPAELRLAQWSDFDFVTAVWTVPSELMKMRRPHRVPLTLQALKVLRQIKEINSAGYLFIVQGDKPVSENTINNTLKLAGYRGKHTGHGFRHLLSTELNERSYNSDWIEMQLAHGSEDKIRATYNHAQYLEHRRQMMQEWADSISKLVANSHAGKVSRVSL